MRKRIKVSDDVVIEIEDGDPPVVWIENVDKFDNATPGQVLLLAPEIKRVIAALAEAAGIIAAWATGEEAFSDDRQTVGDV